MGILGNMKWYTCILAINKMNRLEFELKYIFFKYCLLGEIMWKMHIEDTQYMLVSPSSMKQTWSHKQLSLTFLLHFSAHIKIFDGEILGYFVSHTFQHSTWSI